MCRVSQQEGFDKEIKSLVIALREIPEHLRAAEEKYQKAPTLQAAATAFDEVQWQREFLELHLNKWKRLHQRDPRIYLQGEQWWFYPEDLQRAREVINIYKARRQADLTWNDIDALREAAKGIHSGSEDFDPANWQSVVAPQTDAESQALT